jgi:hypothetical protein
MLRPAAAYLTPHGTKALLALSLENSKKITAAQSQSSPNQVPI